MNRLEIGSSCRIRYNLMSCPGVVCRVLDGKFHAARLTPCVEAPCIISATGWDAIPTILGRLGRGVPSFVEGLWRCGGSGMSSK